MSKLGPSGRGIGKKRRRKRFRNRSKSRSGPVKKYRIEDLEEDNEP